MVETVDDAKAILEANGLYVSWNHARSLWIAGTVRDVGDGIRMSNDASALIQNADGWVGVFPWKGLQAHEVPGTLPDLVSLVLAVYAEYRQSGGELGDAATRVLADRERPTTGRSLTKV